MRKSIVAMLLFGSMVLTCNAQDLRRTEAARAACGSFDDSHLTPGSRALNDVASATVFVIQIANVDGNCLGGNCGPNSQIGLDGNWVGAAKGSSFVTIHVAPGEHHLCASMISRNNKLSELVTLHSLQAEAGKSYYFGLEVIEPTSLGGGFVQYLLRPLDQDEARMLIAAYPEEHSKSR